jgi:hypothetical protein
MDMSIGLAHGKLDFMAHVHGANNLMVFGMGSTLNDIMLDRLENC